MVKKQNSGFYRLNRNIFIDEKQSKEFLSNGFIVTPVSEDPKVEILTSIVKALKEKWNYDDVHQQAPFRFSAYNNNSCWKKEVFNKISAYIEPFINQTLINYIPFVVNLFEKMPNSGDNSISIHQNPSFTDTQTNDSVSIWIPLTNVSKINGTIGVLNGSQTFLHHYRAANMPNIFSNITDYLINTGFKPIEVIKGNAVILNDSIFHWSYPNLSEHSRMAVQVICIPSIAKPQYYYYDDRINRLNIYSIRKEFFFEFNCKEEPTNVPLIRSIPFQYKKISLTKLKIYFLNKRILRLREKVSTVFKKIFNN